MNRVQRTNHAVKTVVVKETIQGELVNVKPGEYKHGDILEFDYNENAYKKVNAETLGTDTRYRIYKGANQTFKDGEKATVARAGVFNIELVNGLPEEQSDKAQNKNRETLISRLETHNIYLEKTL